MHITGVSHLSVNASPNASFTDDHFWNSVFASRHSFPTVNRRRKNKAYLTSPSHRVILVLMGNQTSERLNHLCQATQLSYIGSHVCQMPIH